MNRKKEHPVSITTKSLPQWIALVFTLLLLMVIVSGCDKANSSTHLSAQIIDSPEQLPLDLVVTQIHFGKRQDHARWLYLTTLGGPTKEDVEVTVKANDLVLSPDTDFLVFTTLGSSSGGGIENIEEWRQGIKIRDLSDGSEREIILWSERFLDESIGKPSFFPSGDKLVFPITNFDTDQYTLATINLDGSNLEVIETKPNTLSDFPIISPDGEKILVLCEGIDADSGKPGFMLCIMNIDGSERILLTRDGTSHGTYLFNPDSQTTYFSESKTGFTFKPRYELKSIGIDGNNPQMILDWHWPVGLLAISEDGGELIFIDTPQDENPPRLFIVQTNGDNLRHLAYFDDFLEEWYAVSE